MSSIEQPKYRVLLSENNIELREYDPMLLAEVQVLGERKEAMSQGFKILADYIFGNNLSKGEIRGAITGEFGEKISMTAPVMQQSQGLTWKVRFFMPASYTIDILPKPNSLSISLISIPVKRFVVIRFSGFPGEGSLQLHTEQLKAYISDKRFKVDENPIFAFYNSPWTLPFLRRNEIMMEMQEW